MITEETQAILADIFTNSERPDKMSIELNHSDHSIIVTYEDMDEEWFKELKQEKSYADLIIRRG